MNDGDTVLLGAVWTVLSLLLAAVGVVCLVRDRRLRKRWVTTEGRVVETLESDEGGNKSYQPSVEYRAEGSAEALRVSGDSWYSKPRWSIGDPMLVRYDPATPADGILGTLTGLRFTGAMLLGAGVVLTLVGMSFVVLGVYGPDTPLTRFLIQISVSE